MQRALASDPERRFASVQEFAAALQSASQHEYTPESATFTRATLFTTLEIDPYESVLVATNPENEVVDGESASHQEPTPKNDLSQEDSTLISSGLIPSSLALTTLPGTSNRENPIKDSKKHYFALASIALVMLILLGSVLFAGSIAGMQVLALPMGLLQNQLASGGTTLARDRQGAPDSTSTPTSSPTTTSKHTSNSNPNNVHSQVTPQTTPTSISTTQQPSTTPTPTPETLPPSTSQPKPTPIIAAVDGKNPTTYTVNGQTCDQTLSNSHSKRVTLGGVGATVYFRFSYTCHAAWAKIVFDSALPSGKYGNAKIVRINDGKAFTCDTGGNNYVAPGQTSCYTGMVQDNASETASAYGSYMSSWSSQLGPY